MIKKLIGMVLGFLAVTVLGVAVYGYTIYQQGTETLSKKTYKKIGEETNVIEATEPLTILLMGVDTGNVERTDPWAGNSDSMILLTVNPKTKKTTMMSLERDILTKIETGNGQVQEAKLNAAYANGGAELAISTIQKMMNIHIDRYVMVNMQGLQQLVDAVGGITVNNTLGFPISIADQEEFNKISIGVGEQTLNGEEALVYSRMRYQDPEGDYGRQKRQREVIQKVVAKLLKMDSIGSYKKILSAVSSNVQTSIDLGDTNTLRSLMGYSDALKNIKSYQLAGSDAMINGGSYQVASTEDILKVQNRIKKEVGKKKVSESNLKTSLVLYGSGSSNYGSDDFVNSKGNVASSEVSSNYEAWPSEAAGGGSVSTYNGGTTYSNNYSENTGNYVQEQGTTTPTYNNNGSGVTTYSTVPAAQ